MPEAVSAQLYLTLDIAETARLDSLLDAAKPACVRLMVADGTGREAAAACVASCHGRDIPLLIAGPDDIAVTMARAVGADGVHLMNAPKAVPWVRGELGETVIVGIDPGPLRHDAMIAAESGADYVSLAPDWTDDAVPDEIAWWAAMIETPMVVENAAGAARARLLRDVADFVVAGMDDAVAVSNALSAG